MLTNKHKSTCPVPPENKLGGIGFRAQHYKDVVNNPPDDIGWLEVHPENYFGGGLHRHFLSEARASYPVSFHSVGLSLGSDQPVDTAHLRHIKELIDIYEPFQVSDHVSWSASGNAHLNDLLPLPYTQETLGRLCRNIDQTQEFYGRQVLVENPSTYIQFKESEMPEWDFMNAVAEQSGCGILLDVNNIFVQAHNHNFDAQRYIDAIKPEYVGEIHLAGHIEENFEGGSIYIDTHDQLVKDEVWALYDYTARRLGPIPTLIEWDQDLPDLSVLVDQASKANSIMQNIEIDMEGQSRVAI